MLDVLKILSKRSGLNIVAGRDVKGDVTLYLQDVEVRKALDTVVETLGLAYDEKDNIELCLWIVSKHKSATAQS